MICVDIIIGLNGRLKNYQNYYVQGQMRLASEQVDTGSQPALFVQWGGGSNFLFRELAPAGRVLNS